MAVGVPLAGWMIVSEDSVDLIEVGAGELERGTSGGRLDRIERLHVLAPSDIADEAGVVEHQRLASDLGGEDVVLIAHPGLIDFGAGRIRHDRAIGGAGIQTSRVVGIFIGGARILDLDGKRKLFIDGVGVAQICPEGESGGALSTGLLNRLETRDQREAELPVGRNVGRTDRWINK